MNEYKANPDKRASGTVIEAELDKGKGPVARILVQHGTLKVGDAFVAGNCFGRIRAMVNDKGRRLKEAGPSTPVEITGLTEVPHAGDPFMVFEDERKARDIADKRAITHRQSEMTANTRVTLDDLFKHIKDGEIKDLNVIIKGDVQGSVEALKGSLRKSKSKAFVLKSFIVVLVRSRNPILFWLLLPMRLLSDLTFVQSASESIQQIKRKSIFVCTAYL